jgi:hypothetical protein
LFLLDSQLQEGVARTIDLLGDLSIRECTGTAGYGGFVSTSLPQVAVDKLIDKVISIRTIKHSEADYYSGMAALPDEIEEYRDAQWLREGAGRIETAAQAERFIETVGFASCLTDSRKPGPSLYVAVCGRRDAVMPRNVQKDPECSHTWMLKDEILRRGKVYYGKLSRGKATFLAPRMIPHFRALWGVRRQEEKVRLSKAAKAVLKALRKEWEMASADLRSDSGIQDRKLFTRALDELQAAMIVVPADVVYEPKFTYLWGLTEERFPKELSRTVARQTALREIARCFLDGAGLTVRGELARVTGLSRPDAGLGNRALVKEGYAEMIGPGTYRKLGNSIPCCR